MRYRLQDYSRNSKTYCPNCNKKTFTRLVDTETGELLPNDMGMCNRFIKCNYKKFPQNGEEIETTGEKIALKEKKDPNYYNTLPYEVVEKSLEKQFDSTFAKYLIKRYGEKAKESLQKYKVGYSSYWNGSPIFWQITPTEVRSGKIMAYDNKLKRVKDTNYPHISWVHSKIKDFQLLQCLYGEFLLAEFPQKKICIVESEKTSIVADIHCPDFLWISVSQLFGLNLTKLQPLEGRDVIFYPDKNAFLVWHKKLSSLNLPFEYKLSEYMEYQDVPDGSDLADILLARKEISV